MDSRGWSAGRVGRSWAGRFTVLATAAALVLAGCSSSDGGRQSASTGTAVGPTVTPGSSAGAPAPSPTAGSASPAVSPSPSTPPPGTSPAPSAEPAGPAAVTVTGATATPTVRYGDTSSFTLAVTGATPGTDLSGPISVSDGTTVLAQGTTDAAGAAALAFDNTADPGERTYTVTYGGSGAAQPATGSLTLHSTTTNVDIAIDKVTGVRPGQPATVAARIVGTPQSPTGQVTLSVDGTAIGQGLVDQQGRFSAVLPAATEGRHEITVAYAGDTRFDPATTSGSFTIAPANPGQAGAAAVQAANPCPATADACVDLTNQQAWLQSGGAVTYGPVPITSGAAGSRTRTGTFSVFWKDRDHKSSLFNDAPMPNSVFFDGDIAFHQGSLSRQSNGCIHLSWDASGTFFDTLSKGSTVAVFGAPPY